MAKEVQVNSVTALKEAQKTLATLFYRLGYIRVTFRDKKRKLSSNALSHVWYGELSRQRGDYSAAQYKRICKLEHGVPILLRDDEGFREFWERFFSRLPYEQQVESMKHISVSSTFSQTQFNEYLNEIVKQYAPEGVVLMSHREAER